MINRYKLRQEMFAKKITALDLSKSLGITYQAFYNKLNCKTQFTEKEIDSLVNVFGKDILK